VRRSAEEVSVYRDPQILQKTRSLLMALAWRLRRNSYPIQRIKRPAINNARYRKTNQESGIGITVYLFWHPTQPERDPR